MGIREASLFDAETIAALSVEVWLHTYCGSGIPTPFAQYVLQAFSPDAVRELICDPSEMFLIDVVNYEGNDAIRGYIRCNRPSDRPLTACPPFEIQTLYVRDRHKRQGIGSALLDACYERLYAMGENAVFLTSNAENDDAMQFYRQKNFRQIGETWFDINGKQYLNYVMLKEIADP